MPLIPRWLCLPALAVAISMPGLRAAPAIGTGPAPASSASLAEAPGGTLSLSLRRAPGVVELVLEGVGQAPVLTQAGGAAGGWSGQLQIGMPTGLRFGPQRMSLPEAGLQSVSLSGAGSDYRLEVTPLPGYPLGRPVVSADGRTMVIRFPSAAASVSPPGGSSASLDVRQPGIVPQPVDAPPLQPRAVAPPLGDMAVGSMVLRNQSFVAVSGPAVTLTLRNAPAKDALMAIAQLGGYGFVYVGDGPAATAPAAAGAPALDAGGRPVTIAFRNESYARALNSVLLAAGLQGKTEGNLILAGPNVLAKSFGPQLSKIYRLNQASASSAADYLASLGASITKVTVITNSVTQGTPQANQVAGGTTSQQTSTQNVTTTETYGGGAGPLKGLLGTTDSRLQTITLIGDASVVAVAEGYLRQIDLRQRQVALSVKILDINLDNESDLANSFAFRSGNSFILSDKGALTALFGSAATTFAGPATLNPANNQFVDRFAAVVQSTSTKVLASPTLILSENADAIQGGAAVATAPGMASVASIGRLYGNEAFVTVGEQLVTSFTTQDSASGAPPVCVPVFANAGLTFGARVSKIDDNGFVTFSLSPEISAAVGSPQTIQGCGDIRIVNKRRLDTGNLRVRDGQTLVLTGVISDEVLAVVSKWPVLGDIPFIGQFFRASSTSRRKSELVIMVTPRIIDDTEGGGFGYGYRPQAGEAQRMLSGSM